VAFARSSKKGGIEVRERIRSHLTYANVMATIAVFLVLSGGTAVALNGSNTVFTDDIANDTQPAAGGNPAGGLQAADLRPGSVASSEVANGSLNDEDVGQGTFVNFAANIGTLQPFDCNQDAITGINAQGDHLLLTPSDDDSSPVLTYRIDYRPNQESATLTTCNPFNFTEPDGTTHFNLLVFDAH
jgi:hypothetical protein